MLANSFGFEELCARRSFAVLGDLLSKAGVPTLRFDWTATGDSLDLDSGADFLTVWEADLHAAIDALKAQCGVEEIVIVGLRLGAMFAACAAARRSDVARIVMIAPPASGHAWLREMSALGRMMAPPDTLDPSFQGLDCAGFRMPAQTTAAIKLLSWAGLPARPARRVDLRLAANSSAARIEQALMKAGAEVSSSLFTGYDEMMCDPTASATPLATLSSLATELSRDIGVNAAQADPVAQPVLTGPRFLEERIVMEEPRVSGVLCLPDRRVRRDAIIFLNAGSVPHTGWARLHVDAARSLAQSGVASLRLDLPGIGDNANESDPAVASLFAVKRIQEIRAAIDLLVSRGFDRVSVMGACSGAYQAFHAAQAEPRISNLILVNQHCFVWSSIYAIQLNAWQATKSRAMQVQLAAQPLEDDTLHAARSLAQLLPFAKKVAKGSLSALMSLQSMATSALGREKPVEASFIKLSSRGARVLLAYSEGDAGLAELERHCGPDGVKATSLPGIEKIIIPDADHMLTPAAARTCLTERVLDFINRAEADDRAAGRLTA